MKKLTKVILNPDATQIQDIMKEGYDIVHTERDKENILYRFEKNEEEPKEETTPDCEHCPRLSRKVLINPDTLEIRDLYDRGYVLDKVETLENGSTKWLLIKCMEDTDENCGIKEVIIHYFDGTVDTIDNIEFADFDIDEGVLEVCGDFHTFEED